MLHRHQQSPQELAYRFIRDGIVSGRYEGGARIKSELVAEALGISRMPVREALRQLDAEGLVTLRPNRGAVVTNLTPDDLLELFSIRAVLEGLAAYHAASRIRPEALFDLEHQISRMALVRHDYRLWIEAHDAFHESLCSFSGLQRVCAQLINIRQQVRPYLRLYAEQHSDPEIAGHEHQVLVDRLKNGDPTAAETAMRNHVLSNGASVVGTWRGFIQAGRGADPMGVTSVDAGSSRMPP